MLLTHADLADRTRANNARDALGALLEVGAVPILNENDSVAVEEIKFGDNDQLAAMVVAARRRRRARAALGRRAACSTQTGAWSRSSRTPREAASLVRPPSKKSDGTGGMASKIEAARRATLAGAHASSPTRAKTRCCSASSPAKTSARSSCHRRAVSRAPHWIAFTLRPRGDLVLDAGAAAAVRRDNKSVLAVGVLGVRGDFRVGDAVRILAPEGDEIGRGLARFDATDATRVAGKKTDDNVLVHRDELVVW